MSKYTTQSVYQVTVLATLSKNAQWLSTQLAKNGNIDTAQSAIVVECQVYHNTDIVRIADSNIVEYWGYSGDIDMIRPLGAMP